jgi:hypothetical protein
MDRTPRPGKFRRENAEPERNNKKSRPGQDDHGNPDQEHGTADYRDNQLSEGTWHQPKPGNGATNRSSPIHGDYVAAHG